MQGAGVTGGSSSGGSGNGWVEGGVAIERSILDGCAPIARMLEVSAAPLWLTPWLPSSGLMRPLWSKRRR